MNKIKQAFSICSQDKELAHEIYIESVKELVHKDYILTTEDAFVDLSAIFGMRWLSHRAVQCNTSYLIQLCAEANTAFNYANIHYRKPLDFVALAERVVPSAQRISDCQLWTIAAQMNHLLIATTSQAIRDRISL